MNQIGSEGSRWLEEFLKEQKQKFLKWFENGKSGNFSRLKEMVIEKGANINWVDDEVFLFFVKWKLCGSSIYNWLKTL